MPAQSEVTPRESGLEADLPYLHRLDDELREGVVMRKDGAFLAGAELELMSWETMTDEELDDTSARMASVLRGLPEGLEYQVEVTRAVVPSLKVPSCGSTHPLMREIHVARKRYLSTIIDRVLENTVRLYVTWAPRRKEPGYWSVIGAHLWPSFQVRNFREREHLALLKEFLGHVSATLSYLEDAGVRSRQLGSAELIRCIREAVNPGAAPSNSEVGPWEYLSDRVVQEELDADAPETPDCLRSGRRHVAVLSQKTYPDAVYAFCLRPLMRLPFPFRFVMGIDLSNQMLELEKQQNSFKYSFAWTNRSTLGGQAAAPDKGALSKHTAHNAVIDAMMSGNARLVPVSLNLVTWVEPREDGSALDELDERVRKSQSTWIQYFKGSELIREGRSSKYYVWLSTLPGWLAASGRRRRYLSPKVADMVVGLVAGRASRGNCGRTTYFDRDGALRPFSVFDVDRNAELLARNILIMASMGGGKSVTIGSLCLGELTMRDLWLRLIDVGGSNAEWAQLLGAVVQKFSLSSRDTDVVNPCMIEKLDDDAMDYLLGFLATLLTKEHEAGLDLAVEGQLATLLKKLYGERPSPGAIILSDIERALLKHPDPRVKELGSRMGYVTAGPYGRILNQRSQKQLAQSQIVYYDFQGCPDRLITILMRAVTHDVLRMANQLGPGIPKLVPIDEGWRLFKSSGSGRSSTGLIDYLARCSRKLRMSTIFCSQSLGEFNSPELRDSIINNAEIQFILKCDREDMGEMARVFKLNEAEIDNLKSLRTVKGEYSEAFLILPRSRGVVRNRLCPEYYWLLTTDPPDRVAREEAYHRFDGDKWAAIRWLAQNYPRGMEAAGLVGGHNVEQDVLQAAVA